MWTNISFTSCEQPILRNTNFCLFTFWVFLPGKSFEYQQLYWHFFMYFNLNSKLLPGKYIQKVNKQKIHCKNSEFVLVVHMSWTKAGDLKLNEIQIFENLLLSIVHWCWAEFGVFKIFKFGTRIVVANFSSKWLHFYK